jgi:DNA polymerase-3 subunit delta'
MMSRVQQVPMHLLTSTQIRAGLQTQYHISDEEAVLIAALAAGRMGWAIDAMEKDDLLSDRQGHLETLSRIPGLSTVQRFDLAQKLSGEKLLQDILELWLLWWRDLLFAIHQCPDLIINVDMRSLLQKQAAKLTQNDTTKMIRAILRTQEALTQNVNARMALEVLMLDVPHLHGA